MKDKLIFIFLDGVGLGRNTYSNPFLKASMPTLSNLIGGRLTNATNILEQTILVKGIDACLGVKGVPQSATGQTCLFTGYNAQAILGHHLMAYPNNELISLINKRSIFKYAKENNVSCAFANSYTDGFFKSLDQSVSSYSVTTHCVLAASIKFNSVSDLLENKAVHWDITNSTLQNLTYKVPLIWPFEAGQNLRGLANHYDLVLFECFLPDLIGHRMDMNKSISFLEMFDEFLNGVIYDNAPNVNVLISSDHGNMEDLSTGGHTNNPVPLIVLGNLAKDFAAVNSIDEIFNAIFSNVFKIKSKEGVCL